MGRGSEKDSGGSPSHPCRFQLGEGGFRRRAALPTLSSGTYYPCVSKTGTPPVFDTDAGAGSSPDEATDRVDPGQAGPPT